MKMNEIEEWEKGEREFFMERKMEEDLGLGVGFLITIIFTNTAAA